MAFLAEEYLCLFVGNMHGTLALTAANKMAAAQTAQDCCQILHLLVNYVQILCSTSLLMPTDAMHLLTWQYLSHMPLQALQGRVHRAPCTMEYIVLWIYAFTSASLAALSWWLHYFLQDRLKARQNKKAAEAALAFLAVSKYAFLW